MRTGSASLFVRVVLASVAALVWAGCGSEGGGNDADALADATLDIPVSPDLIADEIVPVDPGPPDVPTDLDITGSDTSGGCEPACPYSESRYCDPMAGVCRDLECTTCWRDKDCPEGKTCRNIVFTDGTRASVCSGECDSPADCDAGFACPTAEGYCVPMARCPDQCGDGSLGAPCLKDGVNAACGTCNNDLTCIGTSPIAAATCEFDRECIAHGFARETRPDCVEGACGNAVCSVSCMTNPCPEGYAEVRASFASCWCLPVGTAAAGDACPIFNVNLEADSCGDSLTCLGIAAASTGAACTVDADCPITSYFGHPQCVEGFCGTSFCSPRCNESGRCEGAFMPMTVGGTCYCIPVLTGESEAGEPCPVFNVHPEADHCKPGLSCLGLQATEESQACTIDADCPDSLFYRNGQCVDGHCGSSFCTDYCDEHGRCPAGFVPADVGTCLCIPVPVGTTQAFGGCPMGTVNPDADHCASELVCIGMLQEAMTALCASDDDCFGAGTACVEGVCGYAFCAPYCDNDGTCAQGDAFVLGTGTCLCGWAPDAGTSALGESCPFSNSHLDSSQCQAELLCTGLWASATSPECTLPVDCPAVPGHVADCKLGHCGYSGCVGMCDAAGACPGGSTPILDGNSGFQCRCEAGASGSVAAGGACAHANVNLDAGACSEGLACASLLILPWLSAECVEATDCDAADYPGVRECVGGYCGSTYCAAACDGEGACESGMSPIRDSEDRCWCQPANP